MTITKLDELRAIHKLEFLVGDLLDVLPAISKVLTSSSIKERTAASGVISRLSQAGSRFTAVLADTAHPQPQENTEPQSLAAIYAAIAQDLEGTVKRAGKSKNDPHLPTALFELVQASISVLWAAGLAKSKDIGGLTKACFSRQGWDGLHEARLRTIEVDREASHGK